MMTDKTLPLDSNPNGRHSREAQSNESVNPYAEVVDARRPPELVRYDLNMDPYANILPRADRLVTDMEGQQRDESPRGRSRWMVVVSVLLIVILVLPVMTQVWSHLFH